MPRVWYILKPNQWLRNRETSSKEAPQGFCSMLRHASAKWVLKRFWCFHFWRSLKVIKRQQARFGLLFADVIEMIFVIKLRLHEGRCSPVIIWLCLWFSSICFSETSQNFCNLWNRPADHLKAEKNRGYKGSFLTICNFIFSSSISNLILWIFFNQKALEKAQISLTVQQILGDSTKGNMINLTWKIPIFIVIKLNIME